MAQAGQSAPSRLAKDNQQRRLTSAATSYVTAVPGEEGEVRVLQSPPAVALAGEVCRLEVRLRNGSRQDWSGRLGVRLWQASSATAMPLAGLQPVRELVVLPGQTVIESAPMTFPSVRAETRFLAQWFLNGVPQSNPTSVQVLPSEALRELASLAGDAGLGLVDPARRLTPLLERGGVDCAAVNTEALPRFRGKLLLVCTDRLERGDAAGIKDALRGLLAKGVNVVWFRRPDSDEGPSPVVCWCGATGGTLVVADAPPDSESRWTPTDQRQLLVLARLAVTLSPPDPLGRADSETDL